MNDIDRLLEKMEENLDGQGSENMEDVALYEYLKSKYGEHECEMGG